MKMKLLFTGLILVSGSVMAQEYSFQLNLSNLVKTGTSIDQKAMNIIIATNTISKGAQAYYTAGNAIVLQPGFTAQAGSVFLATIGGVFSSDLSKDVPGLSARVYPNPFIEKAIVDYNLPSSGRVRHTLLDNKGQIMQQSEEENEQSTGRHQTQIEGKHLPSGIYLYQIQVGNETRTLRLIKKE